jgi:hypothetical protein
VAAARRLTWDRSSAPPAIKRRAGPARILPGAWSPSGYQAAGPTPRTTVAVWDWPDWSVQLTLILSPGW